MVRGAREDVRPARLRSRHHAGAARRVHEARRLGRRGSAEGHRLHEGGRVVRGPARRAGRPSPLAGAEVPGARVRPSQQQHGHAASGDARAARVARQGGAAALHRALSPSALR